MRVAEAIDASFATNTRFLSVQGPVDVVSRLWMGASIVADDQADLQ